MSAADKISIETPEQINLEFPLAGIGSRFLAMATDTLIQFGIGLVVLLVSVFTPFFFRRVTIVGNMSVQWIWAISGIAFFLLQFGYFAFFEAIWKGQTPGKRRENLRVIKDDGRPITPFDAVGRNLMRIVDSIPFFYGVGIISVFLSGRSKRLGDYLAGTIVVHDKPLDATASLSFRGGDVQVTATARTELTPEQFQLLEAYTVRKHDLEWGLRQKFARQILDKVEASLNISEEDKRDPDAVIERLVQSHRNRG